MLIKIISGTGELALKYRTQLTDGTDSNTGVKFSIHHTPGNLYLGVFHYEDDSVGKDDILVKYYDNGVFHDGEVHPKVRKETHEGIGGAYPDSWWKDLGFPVQIVYDSAKEGRLPDDYELNGIVYTKCAAPERAKYTDANGVKDSWWEDNVNTAEFQ